AWGVGVCFFLNGVSYLAVIWGLLAMRLPPYAPRPAHESAWVGFQEVVRFIRGDRRIATLVVQTALLSIFGFPFLVMMPVFARAGCAMIVNNALTNTTLQTLVPDQLRGRVMGFYSFVFVGMAPLGAFQAGVFAEHAGAPAAVAVGGLVSALVVLVAAWRVPELRKT